MEYQALAAAEVAFWVVVEMLILEIIAVVVPVLVATAATVVMRVVQVHNLELEV